ncbi:hypothetical protein [Mucilaginibacter sp.]|uniref:hypothetical protein n=1 Tax=Mucilaginibacter sp. TaxID=1882438 RepID=UPI0025EBE50C|nr:hypothetical protein [Mucilaginibacter sp.]
MKNHYSFTAGICLLLSSCAVPITYFGDRLSPTTSVEIYYSTHDVKREYKVIGHLTCENYPKQEAVKQRLSEYAKTVGADAVVILGTDATKNNQAAIVNADALKYTDK